MPKVRNDDPVPWALTNEDLLNPKSIGIDIVSKTTRLLTCPVSTQRFFFAERVVKPWNCLPAELHHFSSLSVFKYFVFSTDLSDFVMC